MSLGKKDISRNITSKALFPYKSSKLFLEKFLSLIKENKKNNTKIPNFGVFYIKESPSRIGRNPKSMKNFVISRRNKLSFKASANIKNILN